MRRPMLAAVAALSLLAPGSLALAQSAAPLSVTARMQGGTRAGADLQQPSDIRGGFILPTLGLIAIIALVYVLTKNGDDSVSP